MPLSFYSQQGKSLSILFVSPHLCLPTKVKWILRNVSLDDTTALPTTHNAVLAVWWKRSPWRILSHLQSLLVLHRRTPHMHSLCWEFHQHTMIQCFVVDHRLCFHTSNGELLENTRGEEGGGWYHGTKSLRTAGIVMTELFWSSGHVCTLSSARVQQLRVTAAVFANGGGEAL